MEHALSGEGAHVGALGIFDGLDWKLASSRPAGAPHSLYQLLQHIIFWQDWVVDWLNGKTPRVPKHASGSWLANPGPASKQEWDRAVKQFRRGLKAIERGSRNVDLLSKKRNKSRLEMVQAIASHNSYHIGEATLLRQMIGAWPPPSGGLTW